MADFKYDSVLENVEKIKQIQESVQKIWAPYDVWCCKVKHNFNAQFCFEIKIQASEPVYAQFD